MSSNAFGHLLLRLRVEARRTQEEQAAAINAISGRDTMTRREVSRYENGQNIPTNHTVTHIAMACGLPPDQLKREATAARAQRRKPQEVNDVERRTFLAGPVVAAGLASEPWARLAHALGKGTPLDSPSVEALVERSADLHISENHLPARTLQQNVVTHLDTITAALRHTRTHERVLTIAAGETAALAGWLAWDLGDQHSALAYYKVTADCAEAAGHPPLRALALTYASYGAETPARRLELLAEAAQHVRGPGNATAAAWVHGRHGEELAAAGEANSALRSLDRARVSYEYADPSGEQAWIRFMTPARLDALALSVLGQLAHPELSDVATAATERLGNDLSGAGVVILGDLAAALLRGSGAEQGIDVTRKFLTATAKRPNTMGRVRALAIAGQLPHRERELAAELRAVAS
ncbi:helix-turn-helix domain-containing protein [Streptomyces sp. NPDC093093]|uniref:helix-turn-helix domain-containing protein n=1 Tax=Streptomyces sp. NPDC093093 TaxID=3366025 RepID=UPI00380040C0